jgi:hypothetical protein
MLFFARWFLWPLRLVVTLFAWFMLSLVLVFFIGAGCLVGRLPKETWIRGDLGGLAVGYREMLHFVFLTSPEE